MTWDVRVTPNARRDRDRAVAWFDENQPLAADDFVDDFFRTLRRIERDASIPAIDDHGFRHMAFDTFKYHIWYRIIEGSTDVYVILVNYQGRDPEEIDRRLHTS